jgi:uncharacterized membrane protein HdeD (DUF308 family)
MDRWKVFFNVGGVLIAVGVTFLVLGLVNDILSFVVVGATHFIAGCALGLIGFGQKQKSAACHGCEL